MAKALKITGIILLIMIILIGCGIFYLVKYVDPNQFKDDISNAIYQKTGRQLNIQGDLSWSFFPWVGFRVNNIELNDAPGFGNKPFASAKKIDISIKVMPLLRGKVAVNNIELDSLYVNLIKNKQGESNWSDIGKTNVNTANNKAPATANNKNTTDFNFSIANLTVVNGQINWQDQQKQQSYSLSKVYINGDNIGTSEVFPLTISATVNGKQLPKPISFSFDGQFNISSDLNSIAMNQLDLKLDNLELEGNISAKNLNSNPSYQGDLHLSPLDLRQLLQDFNAKLPAMRDKDALEKVTADLAFNGDKKDLSVKPFNLVLDDTTFSGNLDVKNLSQPAIDFKLNADQLNLDNYMAPKASANNSSNNSKSSNSSGANTDTPINLPIDLLRLLNVQGNIQLGQLVVSNLHVSNVSVDINANKGIIQLAPITMNLYEGTATASTSLNVQSNTPKYKFVVNASKVQAEPLINDFMNKDFITGTANLSANLSTQGNSVNALTAALDGNSKFGFINGVLKGVNVEYQLAQAKALLKKQAPPSAPSNKTTPFGNASGTATINNGVISNNDFILINPGFTANGKGIVNLVQQTINYQLRLTSTKVEGIEGYTIPVNITGSMNSPSVGLDTNDILQQVVNKEKQKLVQQAKQKAQQEAQKKVEQTLGKHIKSKDVSKALGNLFG